MIEVIVDTREQRPYSFDAIPDFRVTSRRKLDTGDYTVRGHEGAVCIERKSLSDLVKSVTSQRKRFNAELARMKEFRWRCVVVDAGIADVMLHKYPSTVAPETVMKHITSIMWRQHVPVFLAGSRAESQILVAAICRDAIR